MHTVTHVQTRLPIAHVAKPRILAISQRNLTVVRADGPRVVRESKEGEDGSLEAGIKRPAEQNPQGALYVDDLPPQAQPKRKDNLSKEMKEKLRGEYYGLGGAENKNVIPYFRQRPTVALLVVEEREASNATASVSDLPEPNLTSTEVAAAATLAPVRSSKFVIDENENLKSTWEHRWWTWGPMLLMAGTQAQAWLQVQTYGDCLGVVLGLLTAYLLADLGTGIYHWGVDNYGDGQTPIFGRQIAAFQGHHQRPWTITERQFCNNVHQVFKPAAFPSALFLLTSPWCAPTFNAFISSFIFLVCMSQQFHAWSHMKKSELPAAVVALQSLGILISRKMHGAHHRSPFENNYCIVSGVWNPLLDASGFFKRVEEAIHVRTGVEPRCWHEPDHDWTEIKRSPAA